MSSFYGDTNSPWYIPYSSEPICKNQASLALSKYMESINNAFSESIKATKFSDSAPQPTWPDRGRVYPYSDYLKDLRLWQEHQDRMNSFYNKEITKFLKDKPYAIWKEPFYKNIEIKDTVIIKRLFYHEINPKFNNPDYSYTTTEWNNDTKEFEEIIVAEPELLDTLNLPENRLENNSDPGWNTSNMNKNYRSVPCVSGPSGPTGSLCFEGEFQYTNTAKISGSYYYLYKIKRSNANYFDFESYNFSPSMLELENNPNALSLPSVVTYDNAEFNINDNMDSIINNILSNIDKELFNKKQIPPYHKNKANQLSTAYLPITTKFKYTVVMRKPIKSKVLVIRKCNTEFREENIANLVFVSNLFFNRDIKNVTKGKNNTNPPGLIKCTEAALYSAYDDRSDQLFEDLNKI